jgi:dolichyl-phosphate-mannose--protein O-mannosyl transferase
MLALGDIAESVLRRAGITKDRVQSLVGKKDCGCNKRQAALNEWGYRWQRAILRAVWVPVVYRIEMLCRRVAYGRVGYAAMHLRLAVRVLIYGR